MVNKIARDLALDRAHDLALDLARARAHALDFDIAHDLAPLGRALAYDLDLARARALDKASVELLDGAMKIGKQAEPIETGIVIGRLAKIRQLAQAAVAAGV